MNGSRFFISFFILRYLSHNLIRVYGYNRIFIIILYLRIVYICDTPTMFSLTHNWVGWPHYIFRIKNAAQRRLTVLLIIIIISMRSSWIWISACSYTHLPFSSMNIDSNPAQHFQPSKLTSSVDTISIP